MQLSPSPSGEYFCLQTLDLYDDAECQSLGTQAAAGRRVQMLNKETDQAVRVMTVEDGYCTWLKKADLRHLEVAEEPYEFVPVDRPEIEARMENILIFAHAAKRVSNTYLWGAPPRRIMIVLDLSRRPTLPRGFGYRATLINRGILLNLCPKKNWNSAI